jgi:hypothetical protein
VIVVEAYEALLEALGQLDGVRAYDDPGAALDPPAVIVAPPMLTFGGPGSDPVTGQFVVIVAVPADERAHLRLWDLLPAVTAAIESVPDAVVTQAAPGSWRTGATDLPCYEVQAEMSLM